MVYTEKKFNKALEVALKTQKKDLCQWYSREFLKKVEEITIKNRIKVLSAYALGIVTPIVLTIIIVVYTM